MRYFDGIFKEILKAFEQVNEVCVFERILKNGEVLKFGKISKIGIIFKFRQFFAEDLHFHPNVTVQTFLWENPPDLNGSAIWRM